MIHYVESNQLSKEIQINNKLIIAEFVIQDSIPCNMQNDILKRVENQLKYNDIDFFKIDLSEEPDAKFVYSINSFPTIVFFKHQQELDRKAGLTEETEIIKIVNDLNN